MSKTSESNHEVKGFVGKVNRREIDQLADKITATMMHPLFGGLVIVLTLVSIGTIFWQMMVAATW